jgi:hypothetical protein
MQVPTGIEVFSPTAVQIRLRGSPVFLLKDIYSDWDLKFTTGLHIIPRRGGFSIRAQGCSPASSFEKN